ncbi:MAG TPA: VOC family protein [Bryobacteraceae bacterium]|nr:VOC family protein [Bryobacteraceae bacterium]
MAVKSIPEGFRTVTPYLVLNNTAEAIDWYKKALGAEEVFRMNGPDGSVVHAEIKIGDSMIMMSDESRMNPGVKSPKTAGTATAGVMLYVNDADALYNQAVAAGATVVHPISDMFWGDRVGNVVDPYGHGWSIATHKEDVTPAEMEKRARALYGKMAGGGA